MERWGNNIQLAGLTASPPSLARQLVGGYWLAKPHAHMRAMDRQAATSNDKPRLAM